MRAAYSLALPFVSAICLGATSAAATVFGAPHSLVIVGDGAPNTGGLVAPPGFFDDIPVGTPVTGSSQYDDTAPQLLAQCFNPSDPTDCYPVYGGGSFSLGIGGAELSMSDFGNGGPFVILDDQWVYDPSGGTPLPPGGNDTVGLSFFQATGSGRLGPDDRWIVLHVGFYRPLAADTFPDPATITGVDLYAFGPLSASLSVQDSQTGNAGTRWMRTRNVE